MTIGSKIRMGTDIIGNRVYGKVIYIHPCKRFVTVEIPAPYGAKVRETVFLGIRRGRDYYRTDRRSFRGLE